MQTNGFAAWVKSGLKLGAAVLGVAAMAGIHVYMANPNVGTADLIVAVVTAVLVWAVPNTPLRPTSSKL